MKKMPIADMLRAVSRPCGMGSGHCAAGQLRSAATLLAALKMAAAASGTMKIHLAQGMRRSRLQRCGK